RNIHAPDCHFARQHDDAALALEAEGRPAGAASEIVRFHHFGEARWPVGAGTADLAVQHQPCVGFVELDVDHEVLVDDEAAIARGIEFEIVEADGLAEIANDLLQHVPLGHRDLSQTASKIGEYSDGAHRPAN